MGWSAAAHPKNRGAWGTKEEADRLVKADGTKEEERGLVKARVLNSTVPEPEARSPQSPKV
jgi:hypothetical protein